MYVSTRSYLTAGIAAFGAGAIALAPVQPLPAAPPLPSALTSTLAVNLAASIDPITPWIETLQAAGDNISGLFTDWAEAPFPIIAQVIANQITYLGELPDIGAILGQVVDNVGNAIRAPFAADPANISDAQIDPPLPRLVQLAIGGNTRQNVYPLIGLLAPALEPIAEFATTPISGLLVGAIGPIVGPALALVNSVSAIIEALGASDFTGALNALINIPANVVNAFLNGGPVLDLTTILPALGIVLPPEISNIGIAMGGLLSPGGVAFDALQTTASVAGITAAIPGLPVGPIGSLIGLTKSIADAIKVVPPTVTVARTAAADTEPAAVEATAEVAEVAAEDAVALSAEPDAAPVADAVTVEATVEHPAAGAGDGDAPTRSARKPAGRSGHSTAADAGDAPKRSGAKAAASRG